MFQRLFALALTSWPQLVRPTLCFAPLLGAAAIAVSRSADNRHHAGDIATGSLLGVICALSTLLFWRFTPDGGMGAFYPARAAHPYTDANDTAVTALYSHNSSKNNNRALADNNANAADDDAILDGAGGSTLAVSSSGSAGMAHRTSSHGGGHNNDFDNSNDDGFPGITGSDAHYCEYDAYTSLTSALHCGPEPPLRVSALGNTAGADGRALLRVTTTAAPATGANQGAGNSFVVVADAEAAAGIALALRNPHSHGHTSSLQQQQQQQGQSLSGSGRGTSSGSGAGSGLGLGPGFGSASVSAQGQQQTRFGGDLA